MSFKKRSILTVLNSSDMIIWHFCDFLDLLHDCKVAGEEEIDNTMKNIYEYHHN